LNSGRRAFCESSKQHKEPINEGTNKIRRSSNSQDLEHKEFEVATPATGINGYELNENNSSMSGMLD